MNWDPTESSASILGVSRNMLKAIDRAANANHYNDEPLVYFPKIFASTGLPIRASYLHNFSRRNGDLTIEIMASSDRGMPSGMYLRLLLVYLATEFKRSGKKRLPVANCVSGLMKMVGVSISGGRHGTFRRFEDELLKISSSVFRVGWKKSGEKALYRLLLPAEEMFLRWRDGKEDGRVLARDSYLQPNDNLLEEILDRSFPVYEIAVRAIQLHRSPMAFDLYMFLASRVLTVHNPVIVPWHSLEQQFGASTKGYGFRKLVKNALQLVRAIYPGIRVATNQKGMLIMPSPTAVPRAGTSRLQCLG